MADIAASVLAKLKNKAKAAGISYQQCLQLFFQEEFLRRLALSRYAENFVLKGGLFIYMQTKWRYFLKTLGNPEIAFADVMEGIKAFLLPVWEAITAENELQKNWDADKKKWR